MDARDNPRGGLRADEAPDNQQERPITIGWITGFTDGEGCFSIGLVRQPDRPGRIGYRTGYQLTHNFRVAQGAKSVEVLHDLRDFFAVGSVHRNGRHDNHREDLYCYSVDSRRELLEVIIPFFRQHPLRTAKRNDFDKFAWCVEAMTRDQHLTREGLIEILQVVETMNRRVSRQEVIGILRGHTSDTRERE